MTSKPAQAHDSTKRLIGCALAPCQNCLSASHHVSCVAHHHMCEVAVGLDIPQHSGAKQLVTPEAALSCVEPSVAGPAHNT